MSTIVIQGFGSTYLITQGFVSFTSGELGIVDCACTFAVAYECESTSNAAYVCVASEES